MKYYLAPMEGITTNVYRNAYHKYFTPIDKYFTPFLVPHSKKGFSTKELREVLPEYNQAMPLVPQILSNNAEDCLDTMRKLREIGYDEVNLNFGCPSKTVVSKNRGSGFLAYPDELDKFLDIVFSGADMKISVKTRIGKLEADEFYRLMEIYNKYPLEELIVHPRRQVDYYKNHPNMEMFAYAMKECKHSLCYNGDLFTAQDVEMFQQEYPEVDMIMLGRGIIRNPGIVEQLTTGKSVDLKKLRSFHDEVMERYMELNSGVSPVFFKMKELWVYMSHTFPGSEKLMKKIYKTNKVEEYVKLVDEVFALHS